MQACAQLQFSYAFFVGLGGEAYLSNAVINALAQQGESSSHPRVSESEKKNFPPHCHELDDYFLMSLQLLEQTRRNALPRKEDLSLRRVCPLGLLDAFPDEERHGRMQAEGIYDGAGRLEPVQARQRLPPELARLDPFPPFLDSASCS